MATNWFEGGRRISVLFIGLTYLAGLAYVAFAATPPIVFSTSAPDDPWRLSSDECEYPSEEKYLYQYDFGGGDKRSVSLCFEASIEEKIPYARAPTPIQPPPIVRVSNGPPPIVRTQPEQKWYYLGSAFNDKVTAYITKRALEFELTPARERQARASFFRAYWASRWNALMEALPVTMGIAVFIWLFTAVMGWIIRGFAGVPTGQDFRPSKIND